MSLSTVLSSKRKDKKNPQFFYENQSNWRLILTWRKQKLELSVFFGWSPKYELYLYPSKENPKLQKKTFFFLNWIRNHFFLWKFYYVIFFPCLCWEPIYFLIWQWKTIVAAFPSSVASPQRCSKTQKKKKTFRARLHIYEYGSVAKLARMLLQED